MNFKLLVLAAAASSTLAACGHIGNEANKKETEAALAGRWASVCEQKNLLFSLAGVKSQQTVFDFYNESAKTVKLFSDDNCQTEIGQVAYKGKVTVGNPTGGEGSNLLDFQYDKVTATISNNTIVTAANLPVTPSCGISNWVAGQERDVTSAAGSPTCPGVSKPAAEYDIAKTDGKTLHFGRVDTAHNKMSQDARPVELDQDVTFTKQ